MQLSITSLARVFTITAVLATAAFVSGPRFPSGISPTGSHWGFHNVIIIYDFGIISTLFSCDFRTFTACSIAEVPLRTFCFGLLASQPFWTAASSLGILSFRKSRISNWSIIAASAIAVPVLFWLAAIWYNERHSTAMDWTCLITQASMLFANVLTFFLAGFALCCTSNYFGCYSKRPDCLFPCISIFILSCILGLVSIASIRYEINKDVFEPPSDASYSIMIPCFLSFLIASLVLRMSSSWVGPARLNAQLLICFINISLISFLSLSHPIFSIYGAHSTKTTIGHFYFFLGAQLGYCVYSARYVRSLTFSLRTAFIGVILLASAMLFYMFKSTELAFLTVSVLIISYVTMSLTYPRSSEVGLRAIEE
jgi:hypothetical protein